MENDIIEKLQKIEEKIDKKKTIWERFISIIEKILIPGALVALAIVTHMTSKQLTQSQLRLTEIQQEFERQRDEQMMQNKQHELDVMYLNLFYEELSKSKNKENTLKLLELLNNDLQVKLAEWIKNDETYDEKTREKANSIIKDLDDLDNFKIGIYYLVGDKNAEIKANNIKNELWNNNIGNAIQLYPKNQEFFKRVKPPTMNEIRYEQIYEETASKQLLESLLILFPNDKIKIRTVSNRTTNFISIFVK